MLAFAKITGRERVTARIPKHGQAVRSQAMSEQQFSCAAQSTESGTVEYRDVVGFPGTAENAYYPTMATLDANFSSVGMTSEQLREFADWLRTVADEVDRIDQEVS